MIDAKLLRQWGRRGGVARAARLSPARRSEIARNAALARWRRVWQREEVLVKRAMCGEPPFAIIERGPVPHPSQQDERGAWE